MAAKHQPHAPMQTPELSMSDSENAYSSDEEELTRDKIDHWLKDAHHYAITEGAKDSGSINKRRIHDINRNLQEISEYGDDCDRKLFRSVKHKIRHILHQLEDDMGVDSSVEDDETSDSVDVVAEEPLDSSPTTHLLLIRWSVVARGMMIWKGRIFTVVPRTPLRFGTGGLRHPCHSQRPFAWPIGRACASTGTWLKQAI
jgi:hypothetical protein